MIVEKMVKCPYTLKPRRLLAPIRIDEQKLFMDEF